MKTKLRILTVTDLHRVRILYEQLGKAVTLHKPDIVAVVGDLLDLGGPNHDQLSTEECAAFLSRLSCTEVLFTRGNHEGDNWWEFLAAWQRTGRALNALHRVAFCHGPLVLVGFPCLLGDETAFATLPGQEQTSTIQSSDYEAWLPDVLRPWGAAARTLWLMHEPPAGTPLSLPDGPISGNPEWVGAIESYLPKLIISGHDHRTPRRAGGWRARLGETVCVNAGQTDSGPLHYCIVDVEFPQTAPCLPSKMQIQAYPWNESLLILGPEVM